MPPYTTSSFPTSGMDFDCATQAKAGVGVPIVEQQTSSSNSHNDTKERRTAETSSDPVLKWMYVVTTYLCVGMVVQILVAPASWLLERSSWHQEVMMPFLRKKLFFRLVPEVILSKYQGHTLVQFTHVVPGAFWAGIIPFQLHSTWRKSHRKAHRFMGYLL